MCINTSSSPQDPRQALKEFATHAKQYSVNLDECVSWDETYVLRGGAAVVRMGTIDLGKKASGKPDFTI